MKVSRHFTCVCILTLVTVNAILLTYISNGDRTLEAALPQNNSISRLSTISTQSDDIKSIRNSTSAQVQVLKSIAQGFQITSSGIMFTTLTVFLLGVTLIIYGLRLTSRVSPGMTYNEFVAQAKSRADKKRVISFAPIYIGLKDGDWASVEAALHAKLYDKAMGNPKD